MKLRQKYLAIMAVPVLVLVVATTLAYTADRRAAASVAAVSRTSQVHLKIRDVLDDLVDSETGTRGLMLTGDPLYLEPFERGSAALPEDLAALWELVRGDELQERRLELLTPLIADRMSVLGRQQELGGIRNQTERTIARPLLARGAALMEEIRGILGEMRAYEESSLRDLQSERKRADDLSNLIQFLILPLGLLLSLALVAAMSGRVVRRILRIQENAERLERGETMLHPDPSKDEVGTLARQMVDVGTRLNDAQEELRHLAITDPLTGIANRRGFLVVAGSQLELARRERRGLTLAYIDVDGLKTVNDTLGHNQGDLLIKEVAALIADTVRTADVVARVGGDEFAVLLIGYPLLDADAAIARIERSIEWASQLPGRDYPISVSVGTARSEGSSHETVEDLMRHADQAMYRVKHAKRAGAVMSERSA